MERTLRHASSGYSQVFVLGPAMPAFVHEDIDAGQRLDRLVARSLHIEIVGDVNGK